MVTTQAYTLTVHLAFTPQTSKGPKLPSHSPLQSRTCRCKVSTWFRKKFAFSSVFLRSFRNRSISRSVSAPRPSLAPSPVPAALGALRREGQPAGFGRHRRRRPRALLVGRPLCAPGAAVNAAYGTLSAWAAGSGAGPLHCGRQRARNMAMTLWPKAVWGSSLFEVISMLQSLLQLCLCLQVEFCELQYFFRVSGAHRFWASAFDVQWIPPGYVPLSHVVCTPLVQNQSSSPRVIFSSWTTLRNPPRKQRHTSTWALTHGPMHASNMYHHTFSSFSVNKAS